MKNKAVLTVAELKQQLSGIPDDCLIHFSSISGIEPTFYRIKAWSRDNDDKPNEIVIEFSEL
ncbi:MAG: hypothetical protein GXP21_08620 [Gammaproteobacteria bacterium]|nr:hypothetical protein [Gammaproteobacteria bacterium]